jgi:glycosyltransferase involved in cell wall biosynthesis
MKVSLFTPTHDNKHLRDTYNSIKDQDFYEWVIVRNGKALSQSFDFIGDDTRVKLLDFTKDGNIGLLKNTACNQCSGDILVGDGLNVGWRAFDVSWEGQ